MVLLVKQPLSFQTESGFDASLGLRNEIKQLEVATIVT